MWLWVLQHTARVWKKKNEPTWSRSLVEGVYGVNFNFLSFSNENKLFSKISLKLKKKIELFIWFPVLETKIITLFFLWMDTLSIEWCWGKLIFLQPFNCLQLFKMFAASIWNTNEVIRWKNDDKFIFNFGKQTIASAIFHSNKPKSVKRIPSGLDICICMRYLKYLYLLWIAPDTKWIISREHNVVSQYSYKYTGGIWKYYPYLIEYFGPPCIAYCE